MDEVREQLERILQCPGLQGSSRRRDLLRFLVEETLAGRADELKGFSVALAVFGRDAGFDTGADPVVRLEAGRLRRSLDTYYIDAGRHDAVRITIPKGAYVPYFERQNRNPATSAEAMAPESSLAFDFPTESLPGPHVDANRTGETGTSRRWFTQAIAALAVLAILAAGAAAWYSLRGGEQNVVDARGPSVIVLPFEASGDGDVRLIASGITQELITGLLRFPDFRLYSAASSFRQNKTAAAVDLGRQLWVTYVVSGSVQSSADQLRLRGQLADAMTGEILWSGSYDRALAPADLINLQSELASAISTELGEPYGAVNEAIGRRMARESAPSMPSYACILRAYDYRRTFQEALFAPALACLKQAVVRDPDYAEAWAMLGWLHLDAVRNDIAPEADRPAEMAAAFDAASHAVDLDRGSQRALEALAAVTFYRGDYAAAEVLQREALALNPHDPDILAQLGWRMAVRGDREGLAYLERAVARSADPPGWYYHLIATYAYLDGDYARALAAAEKSSKYGEAVGLSLAAMSHAKLGDTETARAELAAMAEAWPLMGRDPAAAYRMHHATDAIVEALLDGLRSAGWTPPDETSL